MARSRRWALPGALLLLAACGDDSTSTLGTTAITPIEQGTSPFDDTVTVPSVLPPTVVEDDTVTLPPLPDTLPAPVITTHSNPSGPAQIDVLIGTDAGPQRVEIVAKGSDIQLNITNPAAADSFHVHGYDLEQEVGKGETATINFTADQAGSFEVESHETGAVVMVLVVK